MKKLFVTLIMLALATSTFAYDFSAVCESGQTLYYNILSGDNHELIVTFPNNNPGGWDGYEEPEGDLVIPEFVEHGGIIYTVVYIGNYAFVGCNNITSVVLPNSILRIYSSAFESCQGITSLHLSDNIRRIDHDAFGYCSSLSSEVVIPDQCTFIGGYAFYGCSALTALTLGASVETIQWSAFENCTGLTIIHCNTPTMPYAQHIPSNPYYDDRSIFNNVPTDIPVFVSCLDFDEFQMNPDWSRFTNLEGVFVGVPSLIVDVNNQEYGTAEVLSIPQDCNETTATVRATPAPGHSFGYWKRGATVISFDQEYTFNLSHNTTLTAYFDCAAIINDELAFPDHVIGRTFNSSGQVTNDYPSDFIYNGNGTLTRFDFPTMLSSTYSFVDYPSMVSSVNSSYFGHPIVTENHTYQYNDFDQIMHSEHIHSMYGIAYYDYLYDDNHKLTQINHDVTDPYDPDYEYHTRHTYEYEDNNRTRIDTYYEGYETIFLNTRTTNHYNERMKLLTSQTEKYNNAGEITSNTLKTYLYTESNNTDYVITQTLNNGTWVNSGITHFLFDDKDRIIEYQTGSWSEENGDWNITKKMIYDFNDEDQKLTLSFRKKANGEWIWDYYSGQTLFYEPDLEEWEKALTNYKNLTINQFEFDLHYEIKEIEFPWQSEWYYEIVWDDGSTTYQHLEYASDTTIGTSRPKVIVRSNTHYDRDTINEVTHEYILEENGIVYWWNNTLQEFTTLYDYNAETGDEWEIKVGTESIMVHVDNVDVFEYLGETFKMLQISDANDIFNGDIVVGFGHMTSFFPEKLMNQGKGFRVDGLRCYWVEDALLYHDGNEDCDAIHSELQDIEEHPSKTAFAVYPNPTNNILFVETVHAPSLPEETQYRITNLMGQTLLQGHITAETQQVDIADLPSGMYFISVDEETVKFVVK